MIRNEIKGINKMKDIVKIAFRDCASKGVELPNSNPTEHYSKLLKSAQTSDKVNNSLKKGLFSDEQVKELGLSHTKPDSMVLDNGTEIIFDTNVESVNAHWREKASRSGHWTTKMKAVNNELYKKGEAFLKEVQEFANDNPAFKVVWTETELQENGDLISFTYEGSAVFGIIAKRPTIQTRTLISKETTKKNKGGKKQ